MTLRDRLSTRLLTVYGEASGRLAEPTADGGTTLNIIAAWSSLADECIRQMEWARLECALDWDDYDNVPLSMAPDDWNP